MYCQNCGNKLSEDAKFCSLCGAKLNSNQSNNKKDIYESTKSNASRKEKDKALMVLNASLKEGLVKSTASYLVFYEDRIVVFKLMKKRQNEEIKKLQKRLKDEGKGFFKSSAAMISFWSTFGDRFYNMDPEEVLSEERENFQIFNNDVSMIEFKQSLTIVDQDSQRQKMGQIKINTPSEKLKFQHKYQDSNGNIKNVLSSLFNNTLKYKGKKFIKVFGNNEGFK